jgi:hypothetical protein
MALSMNFAAEDKKKLYLLGGLLGVLGVMGTIFVILPMFGGDTSAETAPDATVTASNIATNSAPTTVPPNNGTQFGNPAMQTSANAGSNAANTAENAVLSPQLIGVGHNRTNPFASDVVGVAPPTPIPTPLPTPRPIYRNVETFKTLSPVPLAPYTPQVESTTIALPGNPGGGFSSGANGSRGAGANTSRILISLPPAAIFGNTARTAPRPLPQVGGLDLASPGAQANIVNAADKRVAGVIIGDTIRALIEYEDNGRQVSRVVQPGDTVGGMEILSIRRMVEGGDATTRVTVRENGEEKFFDLKTR